MQMPNFSSYEEDDDTPMNKTPSPNSTLPWSITQIPSSNHLPSEPWICLLPLEAEEEDIEEDFQTVPLNDEHWGMEEISDRPLCICKHPLPLGLCPYPCPYANYQTSSYYDTLDLSDISKFEDIMTTSSDEDFPPLEDIGYWKDYS